MVIPGVPTIQKELATTASIASWITSAYLIVGSAISPCSESWGTSMGKRECSSSLLSFTWLVWAWQAFPPTIYILILARALQGVGFAIIPLGLAIITDAFPRERVAVAQGIISGTFAIGAALGLIIGSYVVKDLGWQYAFHTALILSLVLFAISAKILQKDIVAAVKKQIDYAGAGILMAGITLVLLYVTEGPSLGWLSTEEIAFLIPGVALTFLFFFVENKIANPLMHLGLLRIRNVLVANLVGLVAGCVMFMLFFASVYYSQLPIGFGLNLDVIAAGLTLAPATIGMLAGGIISGRLLPRVGPKPVLVLVPV